MSLCAEMLVLGSLALDAVHQQITVALPEIEHLRRPDFPELDFDPVADPEPIPDPVIGPQLATARRRLVYPAFYGLADRLVGTSSWVSENLGPAPTDAP